MSIALKMKSIWCGSFGGGVFIVLIFFIVCISFHPQPRQKTWRSSRNIVDMNGEAVPVPDPYRGAAIGWGADLGDFLLATNDPDAARLVWPFLKRHLVDGLLGDIYPQLLQNHAIWNAPMVGGDGAIGWEQFLAAKDQGTILFAWRQIAPMAKRFGVPFAATRQTSDEESHWRQIRMFAAADGTQARAEAVINRRHAGFEHLAQDLGAAPSFPRPKIMMVAFEGAEGVSFGPGINLEWAKMMGRAQVDYVSPQKLITNVERLLKLDPDMIFVMSTVKPKSRRLMPAAIVNHPLWKVMRAVKQHRVYLLQWANPLVSRWVSELAYPQVLAPRLRELVRQSVKADYGFNVTERQLDRLIGQDRNRGMAGAERFEAEAAP